MVAKNLGVTAFHGDLNRSLIIFPPNVNPEIEIRGISEIRGQNKRTLLHLNSSELASIRGSRPKKYSPDLKQLTTDSLHFTKKISLIACMFSFNICITENRNVSKKETPEPT
jgi:hypothetical protein